MKYKSPILVLCILVTLTVLGIRAANAILMDTGGGRYYNTETGMYQNADGSVTSSTSGGYSTALNQQIIDTAVAAGADPSDFSPCTGEILTNQAAAQDCVEKAQAQARARGYDATCTVERVSFPGFDPTTGLDYYLNGTCTINDTTGYGAYLLAGFDAAAGSNAIIQHINPGWGILPTNLQQAIAGTQTNSQFVLCPNGVTFAVAGHLADCPGGTTAGQTSGTGTAAGSSAYIQSAYNLVTSAFNTLNSLYSSLAQTTGQTTTLNQTQTTQTTQNTTTGTTAATQNNTLLSTFCASIIDSSQSCADKAQAQARVRGYTATCSVVATTYPGGSYPQALCTVNGSPNHSAPLMVGSGDGLNNGWANLRLELQREGIQVPAVTNITTTTQTQTTQTAATTQNQTAAQTSVVVSTFPATITVNANLLNIRNAPNTQSAVINQLPRGMTFIAGNVVAGESVEGTNSWWVTTVGMMPAYVWAGGTVQIPGL